MHLNFYIVKPYLDIYIDIRRCVAIRQLSMQVTLCESKTL